MPLPSSHAIRLFRRIPVFWGIVLVALLMRLWFLIVLSPRLDAGSPLSVDASAYHHIAQNLVERRMFTSPVDPPYNPQLPGTFRPPLTPFFLAGIYALFGVNLFYGRLGLTVVSAFSCGLTYWLGKMVFGNTIGLIAGTLSCGYPLLLLFVHLPLTEGLSLFLTLALLALLYAYPVQTERAALVRIRWDVGVGVIFGLLLLNKTSNVTLFPCIVVVFLRSATPFKCLLRLSVIGITAMLLILPWMIRNYRLIGMITPVNSNGGWTFYLGNNPHTEKNLAALEHGLTNGWMPPKEAFQPFADLAFTDIRAWEKRSVELGMAFIRERPGKFFEFALRKIRIFWSPYRNILDQITWYPLVAFSLIGIGSSVLAWKRHLLFYIAILSAMSIPVVFTSMPRFRAPIMPIIIMYGAAGIVNVNRSAKFILRQRAYAHRN